MRKLDLPDVMKMTDEEVESWIRTLSTEIVYAHLPVLAAIVRERFGENAVLSTATFSPPRIIQMEIG